MESSASASVSVSALAAGRGSNNGNTMRSTNTKRSWIRGVNLGGWLLAERFITPYLFALTSCHLQGDFCWYPNQLSAPPRDGSSMTQQQKQHVYCDQFQCQPHMITSADNGRQDFPMDEWTLLGSFSTKAMAKDYMTIHWDHFISRNDVKALYQAGVTHVRVPVPHYMFRSLESEPWVDGQWLYFVRFCGWAREYGLEVWLDLHTAPGSQNGFDNSGQLLEDAPTCQHWITSQGNIDRTLEAIEDIASAVMDDNLRDIVTGFGILNEPFADCNRTTLERFTNDAFRIVRNVMGNDTHVFISDNFNATTWNNGAWWTNPDQYAHTYLDSHYYHVFAEHERALSPKQHVAYTCAKLTRDTESCCYQKNDKNNKDRLPSQGISRIVGEWSAAFDILPVERLHDVMKGIEANFTAPFLLREIDDKRRTFLKDHVEAQMVAYESVQTGVSSGWFYWTVKMEGGAFAEWDFLRGIKEGWIPQLPKREISSESRFGSCKDIAKKTKDDVSIVEEFPDPGDKDRVGWIGPPIDDDYVLSHADSNSDDNGGNDQADNKNDSNDEKSRKKRLKKGPRWFRFLALLLFGYGIWHIFLKDQYGFGRQRQQYQPLHSTSLTI